MKGSDVLRICRLLERIYATDHRSISFDTSVPKGISDIRGDDSNDLHIRVGVREFDRFLNQEFDIADSVTPVVGMFHEIGHALHVHKLYEQKAPLAKAVAFSHFGCKGSRYYYWDCGYHTHPHEIAAEYLGFYGADKFLSRHFGKEASEKMLVSYAKKKSMFFDEDKNCVFVKTVLDDLNVQFADNVLKHREYDFWKDSYLVTSFRNRAFAQSTVEMAMSTGYGMLQDYVQAVTVLKDFDIHGIIKSKPVFDKIPMEPERMIEWLNGFRKAAVPKPKKKELDLFATRKLFAKNEELTGNGPDIWIPEY